MLVCLLDSTQCISPCAIIEHRAWFAVIEPNKMSVNRLIWLFENHGLLKMLVLNLVYRALARFLIKRWDTCKHVIVDFVDDCDVHVQLCGISWI